MPKLAAHLYAAHQNSVLKLAAREGGVSRPQIMNELNVSRSVAAGLIDKCQLALDRKTGRTAFFKPSEVADVPEAPAEPPELPPEVKDVVVAGDDVKDDAYDDDKIAELDAEFVETRKALRDAAARAGKALGDWATHQALVDTLRLRMTEIATERMNAC